MGYEAVKDIEAILKSEEKLKILMDSNVIIAYLDPDHKFNYEASVIIEPLKDKNCYFFIHPLVVGEVINILMDIKKISAKTAIEKVANFCDSLKFTLGGNVPLSRDFIFSIFHKHSRHKKFIKAHFNDFLILNSVEGVKNIKIVTCDKGMQEAGKSIFKKNIYYLPLKTSKSKTELTRFLADMVKVDL